MPKQASTALLVDVQIDAIKRLYTGDITMRDIASEYPSLAHSKQALIGVADKLRTGLADKSLHRECCKALKAPVPERCFSDDEMRDALVAYHFRAEDKRSIGSITGEFGTPKTTLFRHEKRLAAALELAGYAGAKGARAPTHDDARRVAAAIEFPSGGRPTLFLPDEERLLLEMAAKHAEHGHGKGKRLRISYAKRALEHMAEEEVDPALKEKLKCAKLSRQWLSDVEGRVEKMDGKQYHEKKPATLSQTRAAAKKPGQNAAMFAQIQEKYDELGEAGKLPGCQRPDGHWEPPPHLCFGGDEMGIEPNGKRWVKVWARLCQKLVRLRRSEPVALRLGAKHAVRLAPSLC
ncbi:hypothetical protein OAO87_04165 [bacterium]|nr:hypothetical protein [bacterium]